MLRTDKVKHKQVLITDSAGLGFVQSNRTIALIPNCPVNTEIIETTEYAYSPELKTTEKKLPLIGPLIGNLFDTDPKDPKTLVFTKPGIYKINVSCDYKTLVLTLTGAGSGGSGASVMGQYVYGGCGGSAAATILTMPIDLDNVTDIVVTIGAGGQGGQFGKPGLNGQESSIQFYCHNQSHNHHNHHNHTDASVSSAAGTSTCVSVSCGTGSKNIPSPIVVQGAQGPTLTDPGLPGLGHVPTFNGQPGQPGSKVFGSQGSPKGGHGGSATLAIGGRGGLPDTKALTAGSCGSVGGSGGGGGSPWGATGSGGSGGHGYALLQFMF
jgi:hypothetical protein